MRRLLHSGPGGVPKAGLFFFVCSLLFSALAVTRTSGGEVSSPALAVVVHKSSPLEGITSGMLRKILDGDMWEWEDSRRVVLVQQLPESPIYQLALRLVLHTDPKTYQRRLIQSEFQGKDLPLIKTLSSDAMVLKFVGNVPGAIAVVDGALAGITSRTKVLRIDGKLPGDRGYALQ